MVRQDFKEIYKSLNKLSVHSARKFQKQLKRKLVFIKEKPYFYQCMEIDKYKRRCFFLKYVIIYKILNNNVIILRIVS